MIIKTKMTEYPCYRAEQHEDGIHLFNESGACFTVLVNPNVQEVVDGEITVIEANTTLEDRVGTLETDTADLAEALDMLLSGVTE